MNEIIKYINDNPEKKLTQSEAAAMSGYSVWHFCEKFKAATGCTFIEYVNRRKMQTAVKYLLEGRRTVDISEALGYTSVNGF